jgi:hypothetical protein
MQRVKVIYHHYIASINQFLNQENKITKTKIYREAYHFFDNKHRIKLKEQYQKTKYRIRDFFFILTYY